MLYYCVVVLQFTLNFPTGHGRQQKQMLEKTYLMQYYQTTLISTATVCDIHCL